MNQQNTTQTFSFGYQQHGDGEYDPLFKNAQTNVTLDQDEPWTKAMYQFCLFLSGIYGYDIADQIMIYRKHDESLQSLTSVVFDQGGYQWPTTTADEDE